MENDMAPWKIWETLNPEFWDRGFGVNVLRCMGLECEGPPCLFERLYEVTAREQK